MYNWEKQFWGNAIHVKHLTILLSVFLESAVDFRQRLEIFVDASCVFVDRLKGVHVRVEDTTDLKDGIR